MSGARPAGDPGVAAAWVIPGAAALASIAAGFVWLAAAVDAVRGGSSLPAQPFTLGRALVEGSAAWPSVTGWVVAAAIVAVPLGLLGWAVARIVRKVRGRHDVDRRTRHLAPAAERERLGRKARSAEAARLAPAAGGAPGLPIGLSLPGRRAVLQGWEDVSVDIWGPRRGKTTCRAVPAVLAAPGPVVATSNKRDLYDLTAGMRAGLADGPLDGRLEGQPEALAGVLGGRGGRPGPARRVWCFDPQGVATDGQPTFTYNPLDRVRTAVEAQKLAALFVADTREPGSRTDPQWDTAGADLLAWLMLAAAVDARPLADVWGWLADPGDDTAVELLRAHGHDGPARSVDGVQHQPDRMRGSTYGTAQRMARPLINPQLLAWVTPQAGLPAFDPAAFVRSQDTLYALSREGAGSSGAIVTALTSAVCEAAEQAAVLNPDRSGRLAVPMVVVLDEAANVCRWPELPTLYSHYGSRGIVLMTFLQNYSQGSAVWGEHGMRTLWSAATIRLYGGGEADERWLSELSNLIGDHEEIHRTVSVRRGERSVSTDTRERRTLTTAQLTALPKGRAVVLAGGRPVLVEPQHWESSSDADEIRAAAERWAARHA